MELLTSSVSQRLPMAIGNVPSQEIRHGAPFHLVGFFLVWQSSILTPDPSYPTFTCKATDEEHPETCYSLSLMGVFFLATASHGCNFHEDIKHDMQNDCTGYTEHPDVYDNNWLTNRVKLNSQSRTHGRRAKRY